MYCKKQAVNDLYLIRQKKIKKLRVHEKDQLKLRKYNIMR